MTRFFSILLAFIFTSNIAKAETSGHYVGISLINSLQEQLAFDTQANPVAYHSSKYNYSNSISYGLNYRYAFNFGKFFVMPEIYYDYNDSNNNNFEKVGANTYFTLSRIKHSVGVKANIGYDFTDDIAGYVTFGHGELRADVDRGAFNGSGRASSRIILTDEYFVFGLGVKYSINDKFDLGLSYEALKEKKTDDLFNDTDTFRDPALQITRINLLYNF